ncbi:MAG: hypothetical protein ACYTFX_08600 [Planctomycetota bacterium]|jgi:hypothetical protein
MSAGTKQLGKIDMTSAEGLEAAASIYQKMGQPEQAYQYVQAAEAKRLRETTLLREQKLRETLAKQAQKNGHTDYAEAIATGAVDLDEASKVIREQETENLLISRGQQGRRVLAKRAGIGQDEFIALNLDKMTDDQFKSFIQGHEADVKAYQDANGNPMMAKTNKMGKVWDKVTETWRNPSEMGLEPAPSIQKITNVSQKMVEDLGTAAIENFTELHVAANDAQKAIDIIDVNLGLIDDMPTGITGGITHWMKRFGEELGMETDAPNAEVFLSNAGKLVAEEIKAFGSGTGLSDADREYAARMAAGDIKMTPEALKRILTIRRQAAQGTIDNFHKVKESTRKRLGDDGDMVDQFEIRAPAPQQPTASNVLEWDPETGTFK